MTPSAGESVRVHEIEWTDSQVSRLWDYYAETPPYSDLYFARRFGRQILDDSGLPLQQALEVLDFGCGPGFMWDHLKQLGATWKYTALDFSADSIASIVRRAAGDPRFRDAIHVTALPTAMPAAAFDAILLVEVVEHLKDAYLEATLGESVRLLKPGGVLVVSTPNEEDLSQARRFCPSCGAVFHEWQHVRSWSVASLQSCLARHGFRLVQHRTTDYQAREANLGSRLAAARRALRRALGRPARNPHMLAVFQKS
jgi:2-polyprenyl-3-methyl-5-hydroxy-6-metoxy-1,4-benzoquinol methylase